MNKVKETKEMINFVISGKSIENLKIPTRFTKTIKAKEIISTESTKRKSKSMLLAYLMSLYESDLEKRCTPSTVKTTIKKLRTFQKYILEKYNKEKISITLINENDIIDFIHSRNRVNRDYHIKNNVYYQVLRKFYNYLNLNGYKLSTFQYAGKLIQNQSVSIGKNRIKSENSHYNILSDIEIQQCLEYLSRRYNSKRNQLVVLLLLQLPITKDELMSLKTENFTNEHVNYLHKNRPMTMKLGSKSNILIEALKENDKFYLLGRENSPLPFDSTIRKSFHFIRKNLGIPINYRTLQNTMVKKLYELNNSTKTISRHTQLQYDFIDKIITLNNIKLRQTIL